MPDTFGFETPEEALARVRDRFAESRDRVVALGRNASPGVQAGQALANIFGGRVKRALDTREVRKSEAQRLVEETGLSQAEARKLAKQNIKPAFAEVRKARKMEGFQAEAAQTMEKLLPVVGPARAKAAAMHVLAVQLRRNGFKDEASQMALQAAELNQAEDMRLMDVEKAKADIDSTRATTEKTRSDIDATGMSKLTAKQSELIARIDTSTDPQEIATLERELGNIEGAIAKANFISLSDADWEKMSKGTMSKIRAEGLEQELLLNRLTNLEQMLIDSRGKLGATAIGRFGARSAQFMENYFGLPPETIGADTLISDVTEIGGTAGFVAAEIRHALTGAAMSAQEMPLLEPFLATPGESLSKMLAKVRVVRKYTQLDIAKRQELLDGMLAGGDEAAAAKRFVSNMLKEAEAETSRIYGTGAGGRTDPVDETREAISNIDTLIEQAEEAKRQAGR